MQTIGQIAESLGVTTQTIRNYLKVGSQFFSESATRYTGKRFAPSDLEQLQRIQKLRSEGIPFVSLADHLTAAPEIIEEPAPDTRQDTGESSTALMVLLDAHREVIAAKNETIEILQDEIEYLRTEIQVSKSQEVVNASTIEVLKSEIARLRLPWWKRI